MPNRSKTSYTQIDFVTEDPQRKKVSKPIQRFYHVLILLAITTFILNIVQVALLRVIIDTAWIVAPPVILLVVFLTYLVYYVYLDPDSQFCKAWCDSSGAERLARYGVLVNVLVNIILVEFVYLNSVAIPGYKSLTWDTSLNPTNDIEAPSIALIQEIGKDRRAILPTSNSDLAQFCNNKHARPANQKCPQSYSTYNTQWGQVAFNILNGSSYGRLKTGSDLDVLYSFQYDDSTTPMLGLGAFDARFSTNDFSAALNCGIVTWGNFPAGGRAQLAIEQTIVVDNVAALDRKQLCPGFDFGKSFSSYRTVPSSLVPWKMDPKCKVSEPDPTKCIGDVDVYFSSGLVTVQKSRHGKDWVSIFIDEGSILGGVSFVIWFMSIYII